MRSCGDCHYCCVHVKVDAFDKPAGTPCGELVVLNNGTGCCGCYSERPEECKAYTCSWMDNYLGDEMRPDKCGLLLETARIEYPRQLNLLMGFEHVPGKLAEYAEQLAAAAGPGVVIVIIPHDLGTAVVFAQPAEALAFRQFMVACQQRGGVTHHFADGTVEQSLPTN